MADDLDDLLDEVETKFCVKKKSETSALNLDRRKGKNEFVHVDQKQNQRKHQRVRSKLEEDVDDILGLDVDLEISEDGQEKPCENKSSTSSIQSNTPFTIPAKKCFPIYFGGTLCDQGLGSSVNKRICDKLRCTSCDFKVAIFSDYEWNPKTDYLFLRNNAPDFQKLKSNLKRKKGSCAYSCQCSWQNVHELTELKDPKLKWVCGKH
ncbi:cilia- and flagella-associated protein 418 [Patella vulgata]|uniref:cilia- and flagella-associated protein 418 n=1 Tax=Patella vulgata TaxID=6465 RepID=UPI00218023F2|nr:cilia- and flagella-associated protein 418 [Patella vulgata]